MRTIELPDGKQAQFPANTPDDVLHSFAHDYIDNLSKVPSESKPSEFVAKPNPDAQEVDPRQLNALPTFLYDPSGDISRAGAAGATALQGATYGFGNKISSAISAGIAKAYGELTNNEELKNSSFTDLYKEAKGQEKERLQQAEQKYPIQSIATEIAGSIPTGSEILKGVGLAGSGLAKIAGGSVALGGLAAAGNSENPFDIPGNVARSVPESLAMGLITHGVIQGGGKIFSDLGKMIGFKPNETTILAKTFTPEEATKATSLLQDQISKGQTPSLLNTGNPKIDAISAKLATKLMKSGTEGAITLNEALKSQQNNAVPATEKILNNISDTKNYFKDISDLDKSTQQAVDPLYKKGYEEGNNFPILKYDKITTTINPLKTSITSGESSSSQDVSSSMSKNLQGESYAESKKEFKKLKEGERAGGYSVKENMMSNENQNSDINSEKTSTFENESTKQNKTITVGDKIVNQEFRPTNLDELSPKEKEVATKYQDLVDDPRIQNAISETRKKYGIPDSIPDNSSQMLHYVRQVLDDKKNVAKSAGENNLARSLSDLRFKVNGVLEDVAPSLKEADSIYSNSSNIKNANDLGRSFSSFKSPEEFSQQINKIKETGAKSDIIAAKNGVIQGMKDIILSPQNKDNPAKSIINSEFNKRILQQVFTDPKEYNEVVNKLETQSNYLNTIGKLIAKNPANLTPEDEAHAVALSISKPISSSYKVVENFLKNHYSDFNDKNSEEIAKVFLNPSRSIDKLLDAAQKAKPGVKQAIKDLLPAAMAAKIGGVYTQNNQINSQQQ